MEECVDMGSTFNVDMGNTRDVLNAQELNIITNGSTGTAVTVEKIRKRSLSTRERQLHVILHM